MSKEGASLRRQYRRSLKGLVACAAAGLVLAGVAGADSQTTSFVDPVGDAGSSVNITGLRVSSFKPGGPDASIELEATVTRNRLWCGGEDGDLPLLIAIDTDQNPDTGSAFYGTEIELEFVPPANARGGEAVFLRAHGWDFKGAPLPDGFGWGCGPTSGGYALYTSTLGITPTSGFNVVAATDSSRPDTAPDIGTFNYQPVAGTAPPKLGPDTRAPHLVAFPAHGVHGKLATLTYQTLDGRGKTADTIRIYRGRRLLKTIRRPLRDSNPFKLSQVTWRVPRDVRGRVRFSVRSADAAGNESNLRWASLGIR